MASLYRPAYVSNGEKHQVKVWWCKYRDAAGVVRRESLKTTNRAAAQLKLADLVRDAQAGRDGGTTHNRKTLAHHLDDWQEAMEQRKVSAAHVRLALYRVRRVAAGCRWVMIPHLDAQQAAAWLAGITGPDGIAPKTRNDYVDALRSFQGWLLAEKRLRSAERPFAGLKHVRTTTDRRHDRRPLSEAQLARLLTTTYHSTRSFRGLTGQDRHALYLCAVSTGFRAGELEELTPELFRFDDCPPAVLLAAKDAKNRQAVRQPLPASAVTVLRAYVATRPRQRVVWPGTWAQDASEMVKRDLEDAGIPYVVQGPDGPLFADMHALRHAYIARLDKPGMTLKRAMQLARHKDPKLTMRIYGRAQLAELGQAVDDALPDLCPNLCPPANGHERAPMPPDGQPRILNLTGGAVTTGTREDAQLVTTTGEEEKGTSGLFYHGHHQNVTDFAWFLLALCLNLCPADERLAA